MKITKLLIAVAGDIIKQSKRLLPKTKKTWVILFLIAILLGISSKFFITNDDEVAPEINDDLTLVEFAPAASYASENSLSLVGTVRAVNEAQIQTERGGRVTSVRVNAGDIVSAGSVIATLENASEYANLLQAEGAYEIAQASAAQNNVSVNQTTIDFDQALKNAENAYQNAYTIVSNVVYNSLDKFYSNPTSGIIGLKIEGNGNALFLNSEREIFRDILNTWQNNSNVKVTVDNYSLYLDQAISNVERTRNWVDTLLNSVNTADKAEMLNNQSVLSYNTVLNDSRIALNNLTSSLSNTKSSIENAKEALNRAELSGTTNDISVSNAQIKQALGTLRAAQANYEKTILRTSIAGTVNSLKINVGDYLAPSTQVAEVANNNALEISVFVGESDLAFVKVGEKVKIGSNTEGTIISVAPGIDSATQKTEIKIAAEDATLTNGNTVVVNLKIENKNIDSALLIPITSIKFTASKGSVFTIENGKLKSLPVEIGSIRGNLVEITSGISADTQIVKDARGLSENQLVLTE